jgi:Aerobic-type carbon monoxide dehydrogenase, small subunit CoxS/CutS homologs
MSNKTAITVNINRREYAIAVESRRTLADAIREDCGQTGTHIGCEHGVCGACTIIVDGEPMRSCLMFAVQADGRKFGPLRAWLMAKGCIRCSRPSWIITRCNAVSVRRDS